jgi:hypothetical protein
MSSPNIFFCDQAIMTRILLRGATKLSTSFCHGNSPISLRGDIELSTSFSHGNSWIIINDTQVDSD